MAETPTQRAGTFANPRQPWTMRPFRTAAVGDEDRGFAAEAQSPGDPGLEIPGPSGRAQAS